MFMIEIVVLYFCFYINACRNLMHASTISGRVYYHPMIMKCKLFNDCYCYCTYDNYLSCHIPSERLICLTFDHLYALLPSFCSLGNVYHETFWTSIILFLSLLHFVLSLSVLQLRYHFLFVRSPLYP